MAFDPDEYLKQAPEAKPPGGFDPDAYLAESTAVPLPRARPEEAPLAPSMVPAVERAPLPRERPEEAPARLEPIVPPVTAETPEPSQPLYDELADVGRSLKRGVLSFRQGISGTMAGAEARPLQNLTEVERRIAAGEEVPEKDDLFGARFMTPEQRAGLRTELEGNIKKSVGEIAAREQDIKQYPVPPEVQKVTGAKTFAEGWEAFKEAPVKVIAHLGAESLPQAAPALIGGLATAPLKLPALTAAITGAGSYGTDYASEILDGLKEAKVDLSNPEAIQQAMADPALMQRIGQKAHAHATVVGAFDAMSMKLAGTSLLPAAVRPKNVIAEKLVELPIQAPLQGAIGGAGEFGGEQFAGDPVKPGAILGEIFGEAFTAPTDVATALAAKEAPAAAARPPTEATAKAADVEAAVKAGGIDVSTPEVYGPPEMYGPKAPPVPTNVPITTVDGGVQTTSVLEGVADAYDTIFGPGGKPQLVPATPEAGPVAPVLPDKNADYGGWVKVVSDYANELYPPSFPGNVTDEAAAFYNGANNNTWNAGLPDNVPVTKVIAAYNAGQDFVEAQTPAKPPPTGDWMDTVNDQATTLYPDVGGEISPEAMAFENGAHGYEWHMGLPVHVGQEEVAKAYSAGAAFALTQGPQTQAAQRAAWTEGGSKADVAATGAAIVAPVFETTRRPLTAKPEANPNWMRGQEQTVPGPRESFTELRIQVPAETTSTGVGGIVTMPITVRSTVDGHPVALVEGMPDAPSEVGFIRSVLWALRNDIRRIAWTGAFTPVARKMARKLGGTVGSTRVTAARPGVTQVGTTVDPLTGVLTPVWGILDPTGKPLIAMPDRLAVEEVAENNTIYSDVAVLTLPESAIGTVRTPEPYTVETFSASQGASMGTSQASPLSQQSVAPLAMALNKLIKRLNLGISVKVVVHEGDIRYTEGVPDEPGKLRPVVKHGLGVARYLGKTPWTKLYKYSDIVAGEIHVSLKDHHSAEGVWATMTHELGHLIMVTIFQNASAAVRTAVHAAYVKTYYEKMKLTMTMEEVYRLQSNAAFIIDRVLAGEKSSVLLGQLTQEQVDYWVGFSEWFAEQVAKWATTQEKPLSLVDKFFAGMAKRLMAMLKVASDMFGMHYEPVPELTAFLDSFLKSDIGKTMGPQVATQTAQETTKANATQMAPEDTAEPAQPETQAGMDGINGAFNGRPPKEAQEAKAYADKFNRMWKYFTGIHQLALANKHIQSLATYVETVSIAQQTKNAIMVNAQEILEKWNNLGETQADAVAALIDDVQGLTYLTPDEAKRKVSRHPTMAELTSLAQKHGVTPRGLAVYAEVGKSFQDFLTRLEAVGKAEAMKISDETRRNLKLAGIAKQIAALRSKPYFPAMRFGSYTITIRDAAKKVIGFETFETMRQRRQAMKEIQSKYDVSADQIQMGYLDKSVKPLLGVPTALLEMIGEKLDLNATQKDSLEQLKYELSPAESFKHRFQHKKRTAGYSMDFRRAYANYFFHGANHLMKAQHADRMRALAKMIKEEAGNAPDITKRQQIVAQVDNHLEHWLDPKPDWAAIRSIAFLQNLAFSPAAAMQNLSQTVLTTHPFLAAKFGRLNSIPALARAARGLENFYKKRTLESHTNFAQKAIFQGMADGVIKETQAVELAGFADGALLGKGFGGNKIQRGWVKFNEWGAFMFEMAEQFNRRLVFRATLELALAHPNAKYVREAVARRKQTYDQRRAEGWTEAEATAYVVAVDATKETQFEYGKEFAPRVMRGRARAFLVFKTFQQSYFMFLVNNRDARYESLLILAFLGGFMGLPLASDAQEWIQALAYWIFGKNFKLEHEVRKWIIELLGSNEAGDLTADLMLHGVAKRGYMIPHVMDMLAGTVGLDRSYVPTFDRSASISGGAMLPIEVGKLLGPPLQSPEKTIASQAQKASGAVFSTGFVAYNALYNSQLDWTDFKRWEGMFPRALRNVSQAVRAASSGGSRTKTGGNIVEYNVRDPQGAAEVIGMAMGYRPYRENYEWEKAMSKRDAAKMIDIRREQVMRQFGNAVLGKDPEERSKMQQAVREFNAQLQPEERGKAITSESLTQSVETRARDRALQERGLPVKKGDVPIYRREDQLYPGQNRTIRTVPKGMQP